VSGSAVAYSFESDPPIDTRYDVNVTLPVKNKKHDFYYWRAYMYPGSVVKVSWKFDDTVKFMLVHGRDTITSGNKNLFEKRSVVIIDSVSGTYESKDLNGEYYWVFWKSKRSDHGHVSVQADLREYTLNPSNAIDIGQDLCFSFGKQYSVIVASQEDNPMKEKHVLIHKKPRYFLAIPVMMITTLPAIILTVITCRISKRRSGYQPI